MKTWMLSLLILPTAAFALPIVDTGDGNTLDTTMGLSSTHWLACEFTVTDATSIHSIEAFMWYYSSFTSGDVRVALYSDGGNTPGSLLHTTSYFLTNTEGWQGPTTLDWSVEASTYWAAFEVGPTSTFSGSICRPMTWDLALDNYASYVGAQQSWFDNDYVTFAVRINHDAVSVPDTGSTFGLMLGAVGLVMATRSRWLHSLPLP